MGRDSLRVEIVEDRWLGAIIGHPACRVLPSPRGAASLGDLPAEVFAFAKVPAGDVSTVARLAEGGFRLVDTALTLVRSAGPCELPRAGTRPAVPADEAAVAAIARSAFWFNRFRADPEFPDELAGRIKETWARSFFAGRRGTHLIVAEREQEVAGFTLLIVEAERAGLDLIAVRADRQGTGVGSDLIRSAVEATGGRRLQAVTQVANLPSLRLFSRFDFRPTAAEHILHLTRIPAWR